MRLSAALKLCDLKPEQVSLIHKSAFMLGRQRFNRTNWYTLQTSRGQNSYSLGHYAVCFYDPTDKHVSYTLGPSPNTFRLHWAAWLATSPLTPLASSHVECKVRGWGMMLLITKKEFYAVIFPIIDCSLDCGFSAKKGYSPMQYATYKPSQNVNKKAP